MGKVGTNITIVTAFIFSPMSPVFVHMVYELMFSGSITHLHPMILICSVYGYLAMVFVAFPMYRCIGDKIPEHKYLLVLGASLGAFTAMAIMVSMGFFVSLDDSWRADLLDASFILFGGILFGAISGTCFWIIAYSWRPTPDSSK